MSVSYYKLEILVFIVIVLWNSQLKVFWLTLHRPQISGIFFSHGQRLLPGDDSSCPQPPWNSRWEARLGLPLLRLHLNLVCLQDSNLRRPQSCKILSRSLPLSSNTVPIITFCAPKRSWASHIICITSALQNLSPKFLIQPKPTDWLNVFTLLYFPFVYSCCAQTTRDALQVTHSSSLN